MNEDFPLKDTKKISSGKEEEVFSPGEREEKKEEITFPSPPPPEEKKGKNSKMILLLGGGLVLFLLLGFFLLRRGREKQPGEPVTLTYWGLWEPAPVFEGLIARFEEDHPGIKIDYRQQSPRDYKARLQNALARGEGPDIFRLHQTWIPVLKGELTPVPQSVAEELGLESDYFPVIKEALKKEGSFWAVPLMVDSLALYYNKEILSAANKKPPRTWWGLEKVAKELTVRDQETGRIKIAGAALGTTNNVDHWSDIVGLMIFQNEGHPGKPQSQLVEDALLFYLRFAREDQVWDETLPNSTLAFATGKVAFYFAPSWRYFNLKEINPQLNFGITTVPQLPQTGVDQQAAEEGEGELTNVGWATFWVEGVSRRSQHQKEAWEFVRFLASREGLKTLYSAQSQIRDFGEIYPVRELAQQLVTNPFLAPFVTEAGRARFWYLASFTHDNGLNDGLIKYYEDALNRLAEGDDPQATLETLAAGVNQILSRYQLSLE